MDASRGPALLAAGRLASLRLRVLPAGGAAVHRLHTQMSAPYYALVLLSLAGFALAIAAALSAWVTVTYGPTTASKGFFAQTYSSGGASVNTSVSPVGQPAAAGAMLLLGFISGFFHFLNTIHPRGAKAFFPNSQILFCVAALVFTFIGTVVGGGVRYSRAPTLTVPSFTYPLIYTHHATRALTLNAGPRCHHSSGGPGWPYLLRPRLWLRHCGYHYTGDCRGAAGGGLAHARPRARAQVH